eukprot:5741850-Pleurochrysis_carterae.AAC.1
MENTIHQSQYKSIHLLYDHIAKHYECFDGGNVEQQKRQVSHRTAEEGEVGQESRKKKLEKGQMGRGNGEVQTQGEPNTTRDCVEKGQEKYTEGRTKMEKKENKKEEGRGANQYDTQRGQKADEQASARKDPIGQRQRGLHLEMNIGTLNMSGISFGYRGKYIQTEETLLKIRPRDKLREVVEMMKTQGVHLMTLTDTHLSRDGMGE